MSSGIDVVHYWARPRSAFGCALGALMPRAHPPTPSWSQPFWLKAYAVRSAPRILEGVPAQSPPPARAGMGKKGVVDADPAPQRQRLGASAAQDRASAARSGGVRLCLVCKASEKDSPFPTNAGAPESARLRCYTIWIPAKRFIIFAECAALCAPDAEHKQH
eukprot:2083328-Pyramimonas_sp.AAC.1